jgi:small subunit ribosomal protein S1
MAKQYTNTEYPDQEAKHFQDLYEKTFSKIEEGEITTGKIVGFLKDNALIDVGFKSYGLIDKGEFAENDLIIGKEVEVLIDKVENENGALIISYEKANEIKNWTKILNAKNSGEIIVGTCLRRIKGGFVVNLSGISAFLPGSQIDVKPILDYNEYVGKELEFKVVKINHQNDNIIISHRAVIEENLKESSQKILDEIENGQKIKGTIRSMNDSGVNVDLGGLNGFIHITDLTWRRINHPSEIFQLGQEIETLILEFDKTKRKVYLGYKQLRKNPWVDIRLKEGQEIIGKSSVITNKGTFVEIDEMFEGIILDQKIQIGTNIKTTIEKIDKEKRLIYLKQISLETK